MAHAQLPRDADLAERAAILEFDGGLSRAAAEARAVGERLDRHGPGRRPVRGLLGELIAAAHRRDADEVQPVLAALGLGHGRARRPLWGVGHMVAEGGAPSGPSLDAALWRPAAEGEVGAACLVVPAFEDGGLVDLAAERLADGRPHRRLGLAALVGSDVIDRARTSGAPLLLYARLGNWLRGGCHGAVLLDRRAGPARLDGLAAVLCEPALAGLLQPALDRLRRPPRLYRLKSQESPHAA